MDKIIFNSSRYWVNYEQGVQKRKNRLGINFILIDRQLKKVITQQFITILTFFNISEQKITNRLKKYFKYKIKQYEKEVQNG